MDGIINVYKEAGFTSFDVVAKLRGILHIKKIGHTGTLDPEATGVLPVCIGKGTKLCDMLTDRSKEYRAVMRLGVTTDTEDMTGKVLESKEVKVTEEEVTSAVMSFVGDILQMPPMYSALKVNGKKLYEYAREGKVIEREKRPVTIYDISIENVELPLVTFTVHCSKGTYIRSLCRDIGEMLGCGACMESLVRTRVSSFELKDAKTLDEIEKIVRENGSADSILYPVTEVFRELPEYRLNENLNKKGINGNTFEAGELDITEERIRLYALDGTFIGIYALSEDGRYKPEKLFFI